MQLAKGSLALCLCKTTCLCRFLPGPGLRTHVCLITWLENVRVTPFLGFPHSTPVMLGIYVSIFIILANILFICAIYSCIKVDTHQCILCTIQLLSVPSVHLFLSPAALQLFPAAMQTVSKKIVQSRTNSTLVGVFSIILVFISAFVNMVGACTSPARSHF